MRKILVVLLVLSVLGGAFADWWWFDGSAVISAVVDFDDDSDETMIQREQSAGWWPGSDPSMYDCCCNGAGTAKFAINWGTEDGISASLSFNLLGNIWAELNYSGDNYAFYGGSDLWALFGGQYLFDVWGSGNINNVKDYGWLYSTTVWGWYKFFDGMIHLEAALGGRDGGWWLSDTTVEDLLGASLNKTNLDPMGGGLLVNFSFEALDFGIYMKDAFPAAPLPLVADDPLVDSVFSTTVVGLKFGMDPVEFAGFFAVENYTAYFGAKIFMDALTLGMSFYGEFEDEAEAMFGLSAGFDGGVFFAGVQFGYYMDTADEDAWYVAVAPSFWYNVIPDYMRFVLDANFRFNTDEVVWEFYPAITWNFKGTGNHSRLGNWGPIGTGIGIGYRLGGGTDDDTLNELRVAFRWNF